jgi:hypothetical protein
MKSFSVAGREGERFRLAGRSMIGQGAIWALSGHAME